MCQSIGNGFFHSWVRLVVLYKNTRLAEFKLHLSSLGARSVKIAISGQLTRQTLQMNINISDGNHLRCPICRGSNTKKAFGTYIGLFTCPFCHERLVVCKSGHYVRDPFGWRKIVLESALRHQSKPISRLVRDLFSLKRYLFVVGMGIGIVLTTIVITEQNTSYKQYPSSLSRP